MKEITLAVKLQTEADITESKLAQILQSMIQIGIADAQATIEKGDGDIEAATKAVTIDVTSVNTIKVPRVLVRIEEGLAEVVSDTPIAHFICYVDKDNADPAFDHVPAKFADLAVKLGLPVLGADNE